MEFNPNDMMKLVELLRPPAEDEVLQGDTLLTKGSEITSSRKIIDTAENSPKAPNTIEEFEAQQASEAEEQTCIDGRKEPPYTMAYQQAVSAEDVYLQMGAKTPASASCERLIVRIRMAGDRRENMELSVDRGEVSLDSPQYKLRLPLPHPVDPDGSRASWDPAEESLVLTLKLEREFDYINF